MGTALKQEEYSIDYICTHLGEENAADINFGAVIPPIFATSLHVFPDMEGLLSFNPQHPDGKYIYGRVENPTVWLLEKKLAALEKAGGALCFASGMAAITSAVLHCVKPGDHIISIANAYGPTRSFFETMLVKYGVKTTYIGGSDPAEFEEHTKDNTVMYYLESPSTAVMELQDLSAITQIARAKGIKTVIDNTWATPVYQQPLVMGVDIVVHTMSKYIGGHSDIIGGVLCADADIIQQVKANERELLGGIIGPFEAWLAVRGLRTLSSRLSRSSQNALAVAGFLDAHPRVRRINYPGIPSHHQYALACRQMSGSSGLLSFELDDTPENSIVLANRLNMFRKGVSWGGFESLVCMPMYKLTDEEARGRNSHRNLIRLYCGLEYQEDLLSDIAQALGD